VPGGEAGGQVAGTLRVTSRNARFQQWQSLLGNRAKRQRSGEFLVQGVRPISLAAASGWPLHALIYDAGRPLSDWAQQLLRTVDSVQVAMAPDLLAELGEKADSQPELVAVAGLPRDDLDRIPADEGFLGVVLDRPASPGNIGSIIRSADAFGAHGVIVTGHAADVYDPRSVRASTGSLFAAPVVRCASHREVAGWLAARRARGWPVVLAGADEHRAHAAGGRERGHRAERRVAGAVRPPGQHSDDRGRELAERGQRGHRGAVRGRPAAHPGPAERGPSRRVIAGYMTGSRSNGGFLPAEFTGRTLNLLRYEAVLQLWR
jgi:TrmH family RNA methyltransferase